MIRLNCQVPMRLRQLSHNLTQQDIKVLTEVHSAGFGQHLPLPNLFVQGAICDISERAIKVQHRPLA